MYRFFFLNNQHRPNLHVGRFFVGIFHAKEVNFNWQE